MALKAGPWTPPTTEQAFAFMIMSGAVARETRVPGERSLELLGPGDVVLSSPVDALGSVPSVALWEALQPSEVALLDARFEAQAVRAPWILVRLARRASDRADRNLIQMTIAGAHPVRRRVELLLWHLADRWGIRKEGGVNLPIRLTQRTLAALTATERSTVCRVLIELVEDGTLEHLAEKHLRLLGPPPSQQLIELAEERLSLERGALADPDK
jgi:CRP-like cAMP-binding protein